MPRLTIDGKPVNVPEGTTILEAAAKLGISIPTLCRWPGLPLNTSCFVCVVRVRGRPTLAPACATVATDGMEIESESDEVRDARRTALELLLSDHQGDCVAPCQLACPAGMDIPRMNRAIAEGRLPDAIRIVKQDIALPAILGRICPAPCEKACRRGDRDAAVSICLLKRFAADTDLALSSPYEPERLPHTGKTVAIVGAGPAGLAAAWHLLRHGHACVLFDAAAAPGGRLRSVIPETRLPRAVIDAEAGLVLRLGAEFRGSHPVAGAAALAELRGRFDAVVLATGEAKPGEAAQWGLRATARGIDIRRETFETSMPGVFAGGDAVRPSRMAVRAVADGKAIASCANDFLSGRAPTPSGRPFSTHYGRLSAEEMAVMAAGFEPSPRQAPAEEAAGFPEEQARREAARCMHCDCRKQRGCRLREVSIAFEAQPSHYRGARRSFERDDAHADVVYESGKCISCGLCLRVCEEVREPLGLSFIGRGFQVRVAAPFGETVAEGLRAAALRCAEVCPTGAIALRKEEDET